MNGSLEDNIVILNKDMNSQSTPSRLMNLRVACEVGNIILSCGPIVATQDAAKVYTDIKGSQRRNKSGEFYQILSRHLNVLQVYTYGKAFLVKNTGSNIEIRIQTILTRRQLSTNELMSTYKVSLRPWHTWTLPETDKFLKVRKQN